MEYSEELFSKPMYTKCLTCTVRDIQFTTPSFILAILKQYALPIIQLRLFCPLMSMYAFGYIDQMHRILTVFHRPLLCGYYLIKLLGAKTQA
jgi:hypothetical protein